MIKRKWIAGAALVVGMSLGIGIGSLRAAGVPQTDPLFYSGTLLEGGQPVTGATRNIRISLWKDETSTIVADRTCETVANNTPVEGGRFRVALDPTCVAAVHAEPEQWVEVEVTGTIIGSRAKLGAVPYAVEADHATSATHANDADLLAGSGPSAFSPAAHTHAFSSLTGIPQGLSDGDNDSTQAFMKQGNSGVVSCDTFCEGPQWGQTGTCVGALVEASGQYVSCETTMSPASYLYCWCSRPLLP